jgi:hypothetical protein
MNAKRKSRVLVPALAVTSILATSGCLHPISESAREEVDPGMFGKLAHAGKIAQGRFIARKR